MIAAAIVERPDISQKELAEKTGWNVNTVKYYIRKMQADGILKRVGTSRKGHWIVTIDEDAMATDEEVLSISRKLEIQNKEAYEKLGKC